MTVTTGTDIDKVATAYDGVVLPGERNVVYSDGTEEIAGVDSYIREIALQVQSWAKDTRERGVHSMIDRKKWEPSENPFKHLEQAKHLLGSNDLVGTFQEVVEGLAFGGVKWESDDADKSDLWNQMAAEQNLDEAIRKLYREIWSCSQVVVAAWWDYGDFVIRGKTKAGNARKKRMKIWYPRILTVLDNSRVVPVGMLAFGQEHLAWQATTQEMAAFKAAQSGQMVADEVLQRFFVAKYHPTDLERLELTQLGVDVENLILLNPELVKRHTLTRSDYERWAPVRLRGIFQLTDLRQQLMEADRVTLVGAANYILLVKKGDKDRPAVQEEVNNVKAGFRTLAKVPVIFSDHRLSIEIITPKQDYTLTQEKYDLLDSRIIQRLINTLATSRRGDGNVETPVGATVVKTLENHRHMLRRFLEVALARDVMKHPSNAEVFRDDQRAPSMVYVPGNISVDDANSIAQQIISLRTMRELSRESTLEYFGYDQEAEALRMAIEEVEYDDTFKSVVPFSAANNEAEGGDGKDGDGKDGGEEGAPPANQGAAGGQGGRPKGGGEPSKNPTKTGRTARGTTPRSS
jgi:hypothetical protein